VSKHLKGTSLAGGSNIHQRVENDFYATDPKSVEDLLINYDIDGSSFYEPCCGQGHISKVLEWYYPKAKHYASDLVYRGYGQGNIDFLNTSINNLPIKGKKVDWIITNPPFKLAQEFIDKSLQLTNIGVAIFLKIQFLEGQKRKEWHQKLPLNFVYVFSSRQLVLNNGERINPKTGKEWSSTMCFAWFIWKHGYSGEPIIRWV